MRYYISNHFGFIRGFGEVMTSPSSATHMKLKDAQDFITMHPDHVIIKHGSSKKKGYVVSTQQQFIGQNSSIVYSMKDARYFNSPETAFKYIDTVNITAIDKPVVIDDSYKVIKRPNLVATTVAPTDTAKRTQLSKTVKIKVAGKSRRCFICGSIIEDDDFTIDHIVPISKGGTNSLDNLAPVHIWCNQMKGNMLKDEFTNKIADIASYEAYNNPTSELSMRVIRNMVRGTLANN